MSGMLRPVEPLPFASSVVLADAGLRGGGLWLRQREFVLGGWWGWQVFMAAAASGDQLQFVFVKFD